MRPSVTAARTPSPARPRSSFRLLAAYVLTAASLAGCLTSDPVDESHYGRPPPPTPYNPGSGGHTGGFGDGGYGYGTGGDGGAAPADAGPPVCADSQKRCAVVFRYAAGSEQSVELRGSYRDGAWLRGDVMVKQGSEWQVTVAVPYGQPIEYKYLIDGHTWIVDPQNPNRVSDNTGNSNSLLDAQSCTTYTCDATASVDGGTVVVNPLCDPSLRRCAWTLTVPYNGEQSVELRGDYRAGAWVQGDALTHDGSLWRVTVPVTYDTPVQYKLYVDNARWILDPGNNSTINDGSGSQNSLRAAERCTTWTCEAPPETPAGVFDWRDAVIYFVFVDRFLDGDASNNCHVAGVDTPGNYQGGDWKGVTQKINADYFGGLGVNTLWLTVPVRNTDQSGLGMGADTHLYSGYHGYWPKELAEVEPCFGTRADLKALVDAAHAKGLKVLFDFAMVHVHISSTLYQSHNDWFWPNSYNGGNCLCGQNCDWNAQGQRCWFTDYLPHWNYTVPAARDFVVNAAVQLVLDFGVDGFRLDAIKHVDGTWLTQLRQSIRTRITAAQTPAQRFYMVGETYDFGDRNFIRTFVDPATKLDGQFDFPLRLNLSKSILLRQSGIDELQRFMDGNDDFYGADAVMSTFIGNHDLPRSIHIAEDSPLWGDPYSDGKNLSWANQPVRSTNRRAYERLANAFAVLLTNRGAPLLYYGDEIGLPGAGDPDNRRFMQWSNLSADQTWLKERVARLGALRKAHAALRRGRRTTLSASANLWVYKLVAAGDTVYVAINRGDAQETASGLPSTALQELVNQVSEQGPSVIVPPRQTKIWVAP